MPTRTAEAVRQVQPARINIGLFCIPLCTVLSLLLAPDDPSLPGSLFWPAWVLTAGLCAALVKDIITRGPAQIFRIDNIVSLSLPVVVYMELLQTPYSTELTPSGARSTLIATGLFGFSMAFGASLKPRPLPRTLKSLANANYSPRQLFTIISLCFFLFVLNPLIATDFSPSAIAAGFGAGRWGAPWARGQMGGWDAFRDFLTYFGYGLPTFTVLLALRLKTWFHSFVILSLLFSGVALAFFAQTGSRRLVVVILGSAMLTWLCVEKEKLRPEHYAVIALLIIATLIGLDLMLSNRDHGLSEASYSLEEFRGVRVDNNFYSLGATIQVVPAEAPFVWLGELEYVLVRPIPRIFWPGKPVGPGFDLPEHLGLRGVALSITSIGEWYISFGWLGIIAGGVCLGWLAVWWSQFLEIRAAINAVALYGLGTMVLFLSIRSLQEMVLTTYPILCWWAVDRVFVSRRSALKTTKPRWGSNRRSRAIPRFVNLDSPH